MTLFSESVAEGVRRGDPDAVGEVYVHLADRLLGYLIARVRDRATAEDLVEATFVELLRKGNTINGGPAAIKVWLFRSAYFNALDHIRKVKRRAEDALDDVERLDVEDESAGPGELAIRNERRRTVRARHLPGVTGRSRHGGVWRRSRTPSPARVPAHTGNPELLEEPQVLGQLFTTGHRHWRRPPPAVKQVVLRLDRE